MKSRHFNFNRDVLTYVLGGTIFFGSIGGSIAYYSYEKQHQLCENKIDRNEIFLNDNGKYCYYFEPGEHIIEISRNDCGYRKIEQVDGYTIKEVEINEWLRNNKVVYVNVEPVIAVTQTIDNDKIEFNDFGTVLTKKDNKIK